MVERTSEPTLKLPEDSTELQAFALDSFQIVVIDYPQFVLRVLGSYATRQQNQNPMHIVRNRVYSAITNTLHTDADITARPDPETAAAMRQALEKLHRKHEVDNTAEATQVERRLARLGAYVTEHINWTASNPPETSKPSIIARLRLVQRELIKGSRVYPELRGMVTERPSQKVHKHPPARQPQKKLPLR